MDVALNRSDATDPLAAPLAASVLFVPVTHICFAGASRFALLLEPPA